MGLTVTDRHVHRGLPQIPLADLARTTNGALIRAGTQEQRTDLAQIIIDDRLAATKPQRFDHLPDPHPPSFGSTRNNRWISSLNGSSFDGRDGH